jgi:cyclase
MEILRIDSSVTVFIRPAEGANVGIIHTPEGMILIDTTSSPAEIQALFDAAGAGLKEVRLVVNTHSHSDHTWGNQLFTCPILAHHLCQEHMQASIKNEWSPQTLQSNITETKKTDPNKAEELRQVVESLEIKIPDQVFQERFEGELGGQGYEVIHFGGHTPDLAVVWIPDKRLLFASDLIFQGRYPYIYDADIPAWIDALNRLLKFDAQVIIPGHGVMCGEADIVALRGYLHTSWHLAAEHIRMGHTADEASADPSFPIFPGEKYERLHKANIRYMYQQQTS